MLVTWPRVTPETDLGQQQLQGHYGPVGLRHLAGTEDWECIALDGEKTRARDHYVAAGKINLEKIELYMPIVSPTGADCGM